MILDIVKTALKVGSRLLGGDTGQKMDEVAVALEDNMQKDPEFRKQMLSQELEIKKVYAADFADARELIKESLKSEDAYVRRARPTFMYLFYAIILFNFAIFPILAAAIPAVELFVYPALPSELYWLFGSAFLGYTGFRSYDKRNKLKNGGESHLTIGKRL
jgi:hypothetical protein